MDLLGQHADLLLCHKFEEAVIDEIDARSIATENLISIKETKINFRYWMKPAKALIDQTELHVDTWKHYLHHFWPCRSQAVANAARDRFRFDGADIIELRRCK
jgi:hypothetical protein